MAFMALVFPLTCTRVLIWEALPSQEAIERTQAFGLQSVVFEPWAAKGSANSFVEAYTNAVSELSDAARQSSD